MSSKSRHIILVVVLVLLAVGGVGCTSHYPEAVEERGEVPHPTLRITDLHSWAEWGQLLPEGSTLVGVVTANDEGGNFYHSIVVDDSSAGVEVHIDLYNLAALYPVGTKVVIRADGLRVALEDGCLQLGYEPYEWSGRCVEPLSDRRDIALRVVGWCRAEEPSPHVVGYEEAMGEMCGRLVSLGPLEYVGDLERWGESYYGSSHNLPFVTPEGEVVLVTSSRYADFATLPIPSGRVEVCGILYLDTYNDTVVPRIKIRDIDDVTPL